MPLDTAVDSSGKSEVSDAFSSSAPKAPIMEVLYKDGAPVAEYITTNAAGKEVLTAKGKLLIYIFGTI